MAEKKSLIWDVLSSRYTLHPGGSGKWTLGFTCLEFPGKFNAGDTFGSYHSYSLYLKP